jgi:predicted ribosome quality control (RQC) complex YloA/Tae2 family protein
MLLNEFLKEHRKVEQLESTVARQQQDFQKQLEALTARLSKQESELKNVSKQLPERNVGPQLLAEWH